MSTPAKNLPKSAIAPTVPAAATDATVAAATAAKKPFDPSNVKVARVVTVPQLKLRAGDVVYIQALKPIYKAKEQKLAEGQKCDMEAPFLLDVVDLTTGQLNNIVVGVVLKDIFVEEYPNDAYVGKGFKIIVGEQKAAKAGGGKRYNQYEVYEIEL